MLTRNELLDRLISALHEKQVQLYKDWFKRDTLTRWNDSYEYEDANQLLEEIIELESQYD